MKELLAEIDRIWKKEKIKLTVAQYVYLYYLITENTESEDFLEILEAVNPKGSIKNGLSKLEDLKLVFYEPVNTLLENFTSYAKPTKKAINLLKLTNKDLQFEKLYETYPEFGGFNKERQLRLNMVACRKLFFNKITSNNKFEEIISALEKEKESQSYNNFKYMKSLLNWLKDEQWKCFI